MSFLFLGWLSCDDSLSYRIWLLSEISHLFTGNLPRFKTERDNKLWVSMFKFCVSYRLQCLFTSHHFQIFSVQKWSLHSLGTFSKTIGCQIFNCQILQRGILYNSTVIPSVWPPVLPVTGPKSSPRRQLGNLIHKTCFIAIFYFYTDDGALSSSSYGA